MTEKERAYKFIRTQLCIEKISDAIDQKMKMAQDLVKVCEILAPYNSNLILDVKSFCIQEAKRLTEEIAEMLEEGRGLAAKAEELIEES